MGGREQGRESTGEEEIPSLDLLLWLGEKVDAPVNHTFKDRWSPVTTLSLPEPSPHPIHNLSSTHPRITDAVTTPQDLTALYQHGGVFEDKMESQRFQLQVGKSAHTCVLFPFPSLRFTVTKPILNTLSLVLRYAPQSEAPCALGGPWQPFAPPLEISVLGPDL